VNSVVVRTIFVYLLMSAMRKKRYAIDTAHCSLLTSHFLTFIAGIYRNDRLAAGSGTFSSGRIQLGNKAAFVVKAHTLLADCTNPVRGFHHLMNNHQRFALIFSFLPFHITLLLNFNQFPGFYQFRQLFNGVCKKVFCSTFVIPFFFLADVGALGLGEPFVLGTPTEPLCGEGSPLEDPHNQNITKSGGKGKETQRGKKT
jgi:hypothetical protein